MMAVEMIGWIAPRVSSELIPPVGPPLNPDVIVKTARIHEEAGFDRVLIRYFSNAPDGFLIGACGDGDRSAQVSARPPAGLYGPDRGRTQACHPRPADGWAHSRPSDRGYEQRGPSARWGLHRPRYALPPNLGVCHPLAAHVDVTLAVRSRGRVLPGRGRLCRHGLSTGAAHPHLWRWRVRSRDRGPGPVRRDVYMLWGEPLQATAAFMEEVRAVAVRTNHRLTFSLSTRPILGHTEGEAWDRHRDILAKVKARQQGAAPTPQNTGSLRLLDATAEQEVHDRCLWMALARSQVPGSTRRR